jgi:serine/threonine protein kinase
MTGILQALSFCIRRDVMNVEQWQNVDRLFVEALALPQAERPGFVRTACGDDRGLREQLEELLEEDEQLDDFLEEPLAPAQVAELLGDAPGGLPEGFRLGAYTVRRPLGCGGSATVYEVEAEGRRFALKLARQAINDDLRRCFHKEREILLRLDHPNIVKLHDTGVTDDGQPYLILEYVDGQVGHRYCDGHRSTVESRLRLFVQICEAVAHTHDQGLVHRDLKPCNFLVTPGEQIKLLDFGIAKALVANFDFAKGDSTKVGGQMLTWGWASPEQVHALRVEPSSDVYALGAILFEALSGHSPYLLGKAPLPLAIERAVCHDRPLLMSEALLHPPASDLGFPWRETELDARDVAEKRSCVDPEELAGLLRGNLDSIVARAMAKCPNRRLTVGELVEDLRGHLDGRRTDTHSFHFQKPDPSCPERCHEVCRLLDLRIVRGTGEEL